LRRAERSYLESSRNARRQVWEFVALATGISLAINLLSTVISAYIGIYGSATLGGVILICGFAYLIHIRTENRKFSIELESIFIVVGDNLRTLTPVPGYWFSEEFTRVANAVFAENGALKRQWDDEEDTGEKFHPLGRARPWTKPQRRLIREISEYILLQRLSVHLEDYFNKSGLDGKKISRFARDKLPDVLLSNRVLELISRDMADRPDFDPAPPHDGWKIIATQTSSGMIFDHFEVRLPKDSTLRREGKDAIVVESPVLKITLVSEFRGYANVIPRALEDHIFGKKYRRVSPWQVEYSVHVEVKNPLRTRKVAWPYYTWVDSFLDKAKKELDFDEYLRQINWSSLKMLLPAIDAINSTALICTERLSGPDDSKRV
jgi:hypothetical protein